MKLNVAEIEVESEGFTSTGFTIAADDPQIIEILTQKIYTDPFVFPRELMANAIDSGGIYELIMPDSLNPQWEVEDHGAGMSHEFMMNEYTRIFHSTKRKDNNNIGGFGHGRLSPIAYTDSYTVRSRFRGADGRIMEGNYVVYRGPNKVPMISCVAMSKSEVEQTGVRVVVPVANKDITTINSKTQYFGQYLTPTPPGVTAVKHEFKSKAGGVREFADYNRYNQESGGARIVIGGVPYPAPTGAVSRDINIDLFFDIGDLEVTLSRDAINATTEAVTKIKDRLNQLVKDYQAHVVEELKKKATVYEKYLAHQKLVEDTGYSFRSYFLNMSSTVSSTIPIKEIMDAMKGSFAIHMLNSDIDKSIWDGMDNETKSFRSLNALRIFMLNDRCDIERRDGRQSTKDLVCSDMFYRTPVENGKPLIVPFAVQLPYSQGQIKKIKTVIAKKLAEIRDKKEHKRLHVILIQYTDKADVKTFFDKIVSGLDPTFIDTGMVAGSKLARYVPLLKWDNGHGQLRKQAMSENVLATAKNVVYLERDAAKSESLYVDGLHLLNRYFPSVFKDNLVLVVNPTDKKYLPQGSVEFKDVVSKVIAKDYGYDYKEGLFDSDRTLKDAAKRETIFAVLSIKVKNANGIRDKNLAHWLAQQPDLIKAKPAVAKQLEGFDELISDRVPTGSPANVDDLRGKLSCLLQLRDRYGLIAKADMPPATKTLATFKASVSQSDLANFSSTYKLLESLTYASDYRYYGYSKEIAVEVLNYIVKH